MLFHILYHQCNKLKCFYLDSELKPASDMLRQCVGDNNSPYRFNCEEDPMKQVLPEDVKETARMNDIAIQRGFSSYNVDNFNTNGNNPSALIFSSASVSWFESSSLSIFKLGVSISNPEVSIPASSKS